MDSEETIIVIVIVMLYLAFLKYICMNKNFWRKLCTNNHIPTKNNTNIIINKIRISDVISPIHDDDKNDDDKNDDDKNDDDKNDDAKLSMSTIDF